MSRRPRGEPEALSELRSWACQPLEGLGLEDQGDGRAQTPEPPGRKCARTADPRERRALNTAPHGTQAPHAHTPRPL